MNAVTAVRRGRVDNRLTAVHNLVRFAALPSAVAIAVIGAAVWAVRFYAELTGAPYVIGMDARFYFERAASWLAGDGFYLPWQLTGQSYVVEQGAATYPPTALLLFAPFALGLPGILWWAIPIGVFVAALVRVRPAWWAWPILAALLLYPRTWVVVALGNPSMWVIAAVAAGIAWGWPAVAVLLKPTLAPLALVGARRGSWWVALAATVLLSIPFLPMWLDYLTVLTHATSNRGIEYTLGEWPIALVVAGVLWISRRGGAGRAPATAR